MVVELKYKKNIICPNNIINRILYCTTFINMICWLQVFHVCGDPDKPLLPSKACTALTQISNLLVTLNSSVNFVIYCIYGEKFKRLFCYLFCKPCGGGAENQHIQRYTTTRGNACEKSYATQVYDKKTSVSEMNHTLMTDAPNPKLKTISEVRWCELQESNMFHSFYIKLKMLSLLSRIVALNCNNGKDGQVVFAKDGKLCHSDALTS